MLFRSGISFRQRNLRSAHRAGISAFALRRFWGEILLALLCILFLPVRTAGQITVTIQPAVANVPAGGTLQFTANVAGTANTGVNWTIPEGPQGGTISSTGSYMAPSYPGAFHVVATSQADTSQSATAMVIVPGILVPDLRVQRTDHTATTLQDGRVLLAGGLDITGTLVTAAAELYDPNADSFALTGNMLIARCCTAAALLQNGQVLIAGGQKLPGGETAEAELYDPTTGMFTTTGSLGAPRSGAVAITLTNGKVLIAGGVSCTSTCVTFNSAELYDPSSGTFSPTGSMSAARGFATATLLPNGKVLIAGSEAFLSSTEIYDPGAGVFTPGPPMSTGRAFFTATLFAAGKVLLAGGVNTNGSLASADVYDSATNTITPTGNLTVGRSSHSATLLSTGRVLIAGGDGNAGQAAVSELYDPATGTFNVTGDLNDPRSAHTATALASGKVLLAGGGNGFGALGSAELYDPASGIFSTKTVLLKSPRALHTQTTLVDGRILVAGGINCIIPPCNPTASAEILDSAVGKFALTGSMANGRFAHTATLLNSGKVLVAGGWSGTAPGPIPQSPLGTAELWDPATNTFTQTGSLVTPRANHAAVLLPNGKVLMTGGESSFENVAGDLASAEIYDPGSGTFTAIGNMTSTRFWHTATLLSTGDVLIAGGAQTGTTINTEPVFFLATAELFDPSTNSFAPTNPMALAPVHHTATLLTNGRVLIGNGILGSQYYDPLTGQFILIGARPGSVFREDHAAALLPNGQVLLAGGAQRGPRPSSFTTDVYDPNLNTLVAGDNLRLNRANPTASALPGGNILIAGGTSFDGALNGGLAVDIYQSPFPPPLPTVTSVTPSTVTGFNPVTLTVQGSGFLPNAVATVDSSPMATTFVSATEQTAIFSAAQIEAQLGNRGISVHNPGGLSTPPFNILVQNAAIEVLPNGAPVIFGNVNVGSNAVQSITVEAGGNLPLVLSALSITGTNPGDFAFSKTSTCPLNGGTTPACQIDVIFTPTSAGGRNAQVTIPSNATPNAINEALVGMGVSSPNILFSPAMLSFGDQQVGTSSSPQSVSLTNTGDMPLAVNFIGFSSPGDYSQTNNCPASLPAAATCKIQVTFAPGTTGVRNNSVVVDDNAPVGQGTQTVALSGTGTNLILGPASGGSTSASVPSGQPATYQLQAAPSNFSGSVNLTVDCSGVPAATCSATPNPINVTPATPTVFAVKVTTQPFSTGAMPDRVSRRDIPPIAFDKSLARMASFSLLLLLALLTRRGHGMPTVRRRALMTTATLLLVILLVACGGGGGGGGGPHGTPPNTYTVVVTASSQGAVQKLNLTLTVQ